MTEEKALKKKIKEDNAALHMKTKVTIEGLSDSEVLELLRKKWIVPLVDGMRSLPDLVLSEFTGKLDALCKKYEMTLDDVEKEIVDTEQLNNLTGSEFDMKGLAEFKKLLGGA